MTNPNQIGHDIDVTFEATVIADSNSGWLCVQMPDYAEFFGTGKAVKIGGTVDGYVGCCTGPNSPGEGRPPDEHVAFSD
ncbi:DUF1905 domain-containing protein [Arthrobacter terrae]|uniref:DUF1905 domain-containing protein n=1 Tax=Arthrobacter terrae TaxID=2935737 RepID=UPI001E5B3CBF|nr:DUF1905 domain-containing protein [Arthrobacter terrae]